MSHIYAPSKITSHIYAPSKRTGLPGQVRVKGHDTCTQHLHMVLVHDRAKESSTVTKQYQVKKQSSVTIQDQVSQEEKLYLYIVCTHTAL